MGVRAMTINQDLFQRVYDQITSEPETHDQCDWEGRDECGTTRCVGGWAIHFTNPGRGVDDAAFALGFTMISQYARHLLGLDETQAQTLFYYVNNEQAVTIAGEFAEHGHSDTLDQYIGQMEF